jgi:hypothetical protein
MPLQNSQGCGPCIRVMNRCSRVSPTLDHRDGRWGLQTFRGKSEAILGFSAEAFAPLTPKTTPPCLQWPRSSRAQIHLHGSPRRSDCLPVGVCHETQQIREAKICPTIAVHESRSRKKFTRVFHMEAKSDPRLVCRDPTTVQSSLSMLNVMAGTDLT